MGEVLPQGNPPKSLRGQPRTPVRLLAHEKAQCRDQCPRQRDRKEKGDDVGKEMRLSLSEYLRQRAVDYEPGGQPPKEVFTVLDKIDELAESESSSPHSSIVDCTDEIRDLLIGGH